MDKLLAWARQHIWLLAALLVTVLLALVPPFIVFVLTGSFSSTPQLYGDMLIYTAHMREVATGNLFFGNPYFIEHRFDVPLALFGSSILAAVPMLLGLSLIAALNLNFVLWSALFTFLFYCLLREFLPHKWLAASGALFAYVSAYDILDRPSVDQEVYPFFLLFYIYLARFLKDGSRANMLWLGFWTGVTFYVYGYLWQIAVATLGLVALYSIAIRNWQQLRRTLLVSALGGVIGAPAFFYTLYVTGMPYFWESMDRWGLVHTHLPMAEIIYSGGWVILSLCIAGLLYWRAEGVRRSVRLRHAFLFLFITGIALWVMQGSNAITGQLLELGEHLRRFIFPWLPVSSIVLAYAAWEVRAEMGSRLRLATAVLWVPLACATMYFGAMTATELIPTQARQAGLERVQEYAGPLQWLDQAEKSPVVVWADPHGDSAAYTTGITKHYVLFETFGEFNLLSNDEFYERYLVSQYFNNPTAEDLERDLALYVGRAKAFHSANTIAREVKICKLLYFYDGGRDCGTAPSAAQYLGPEFFASLEKKFKTDIVPHIGEYLNKYHVSYILKDKTQDTEYAPEKLGATLVYDDDNFALYKLPAQ